MRYLVRGVEVEIDGDLVRVLKRLPKRRWGPVGYIRIDRDEVPSLVRVLEELGHQVRITNRERSQE